YGFRMNEYRGFSLPMVRLAMSPSTRPGRGPCPSLEHERPELTVFVEVGPDARPVPARDLAAVVIHPVEVRPPPGAGAGGNVAHGLERAMGNDPPGPPAGTLPARPECASDGRRRVADLAVPLVMPGAPAQVLALEVGHNDRQLAAERRDFILEVDRVTLV